MYEWLGNSDLLIIRADRKEPLCVLPLWLAAELAAVAEGHQSLSGLHPSHSPSPCGRIDHTDDKGAK
jgi:hypothetical protein